MHVPTLFSIGYFSYLSALEYRIFTRAVYLITAYYIVAVLFLLRIVRVLHPVQLQKQSSHIIKASHFPQNTALTGSNTCILKTGML
jgi:hypothetical protein